MNAWRAYLLLLLILLPVVVLVGVGAWALWITGWLGWLWWLLPVFWAAAFLLAKRWQKQLVPLPQAEFKTTIHWTAQDEQAAALIVEEQNAVRDIAPDQLSDPQFYFDKAMSLSLRIARVYRPKDQDPVSGLTIPEILTAARLACEDLEKWVREYLPGSHLLTVSQWRTLSKAPSWMKTVSNVSWLASMLLHVGNIGRFAAWKIAIEPVTREMHHNVLASFYVMFLRHVGIYIIELNSGRLRGGTEAYQQMIAQLADRAGEESSPSLSDDADAEDTLTIALVGQVKAGKSSLINLLLGEQHAATDVLPKTQNVCRYRLELPQRHDRIVLLDTPGYGSDGPTEEQVSDTAIAVRDANMILLVMDASSPARAADQKLLRLLAARFSWQPEQKPPPLLGVLTHIDRLAPVLEWSPPYDWTDPAAAKEINIRDAVQYNAQQLGPVLRGVVPVCSDEARGRDYGVEQWLVPAIATLLDEARASALIRTLYGSLDQNRLSSLLVQLRNAGSVLLQAISFDPDVKRHSVDG